MRPATIVLLLLGLASAGSAQDGGKVAWKGKTDDPQAAVTEARRQSKPMMLFFTSFGSDPCKQMSAKLFSDEAVVRASEGLLCVMVECSSGKSNKDLSGLYGVTSYPTVLFCDAEGKPVAELATADPAAAAKQIREFIVKASVKPEVRIPIPEIKGMTYEEARSHAKKLSRPIAYYFSDESPASQTVNLAFADEHVKEAFTKFVFAKTDYRKGSAECQKFDVNRAPTFLILDPFLEKPEEKPIDRITGSRNARELLRDLENALRLAAAARPAKSSKEGPADLKPAEKLSDDEIERKFIQARVAVAMELQKKGKKDKAIEVLEDILKSFPKHVDTPAVQKLLEDLRK